MIAAGTLVVVLGANNVDEAIGDYDGAGDTTRDMAFRFDEDLTGTLTQSFYLRNSGDEAVTGERFDPYNDDSLEWDASDCGEVPTWEPGGECTVSVTWAPDTALDGYHEATLILFSDDAERPELTLFASADKESEGCSAIGSRALGVGWLLAAGLLIRRRSAAG